MFTTNHCPLAITATREELDNGLTLYWVEQPALPVVATALCFRAGTRDEQPGTFGLAHFLEHMMFRGSERFGPGELDRRTEALGGANNAFTSYDSTVYHFSLGSAGLPEVMAMEADRMRSLTLDPELIEAEREVVLEELLLCDDSPWEAIDRAVRAELFGEHPYGRSILGEIDDLRAITAADFERFHQCYYQPRNGILVLVGATDEDDRSAVRKAFSLERQRPLIRPATTAPPAWGSTRSGTGTGKRELALRRGQRSRLSLSFLAPPVGDPDHAVLDCVATLLSGGRTSVLQRRLVEDRALATWVDVGLEECLDAGKFEIAIELAGDDGLEEVERIVVEELARLAECGVDAAQAAKMKKLQTMDWVYSNLHAAELATTLAEWIALFGESALDRQFAQLAAVRSADVQRVVCDYLDPERCGVWMRSLPEGSSGSPSRSQLEIVPGRQR